MVYSDNDSAFIKASKWLEQPRKDEKSHGLLDEYEIKWKNLSRAPWWGGQFERLIGLVKRLCLSSLEEGILPGKSYARCC